jgi:AcrR family transcriptional regulator
MGRIAGVTRDETRQRLLAAAADVFARRGFDGATLAEIAEHAGLSTGAIYGLFSGKAELFAASVEARAETELERVLRAAEVEGRIGAMLRQRGEALNGPSERNETLVVQAILAAAHDPDLAASLTQTLLTREYHLAALIGAAQDTGDLDASLSALAGARLLSMLGLGAILLGVLDLDPVPPDEWSALIGRLVDATRAPHQLRTDHGAAT